MKEMMKKVRERREGFTMAELLIVVAIIAVLVAIAIPVFTAQLEKSRDAVSVANIRTAYAEASSAFLTSTKSGTVDGVVVTLNTDGSGTAKVSTVELKGTASGWSDADTNLPFVHTVMDADMGAVSGKKALKFTFATDGTCTLTTVE